jgi:hypothetical protein
MPEVDLVCPFCGYSCPDLHSQATHLMQCHRVVWVQVGKHRVPFRVRHQRGSWQKVTCICGAAFAIVLDVAPAFQDWAAKHLAEIDTFVKHLRAVRGLGEHLRRLREQYLLDQVGGDVPRLPEGAVAWRDDLHEPDPTGGDDGGPTGGEDRGEGG